MDADAAREIKSLIEDSVSRVEQGSRLVGEAGATMAVRIAALRAEFAAIQEVHELCDSLQASAAGVHGRALETKRTDDKRSVPAMWQPNIRPEGASAKP